MYFKFYKLKSCVKRSAKRRRRFIQRFLKQETHQTAAAFTAYVSGGREKAAASHHRSVKDVNTAFGKRVSSPWTLVINPQTTRFGGSFFI